MRRRTFLKIGFTGGLSYRSLLHASAGPTRQTLQGSLYPRPRYPSAASATSLSQLLPNARHIIRRKKLNSRPGYAIKGGERVLFFAYGYFDPMVIEAFNLAFREMDCAVDQVSMSGPRKLWNSADVLELVVRKSPENDVRLWNMRIPYVSELLERYDAIIAPDYLPASHVIQAAYGNKDLPIVWPTREMLADSSVIQYPEEILEVIERKAWSIIRRAHKVHITDPEGTDLRFTYHEDYWKILEGTHPAYRIAGAGPGKSELPQVEGHLMGVPRYALPENDAEGIVAGTVDHIGPYPRLEIEVRGGRAVRLQGGGRFGDLWREYIESTKGIHYPHQPAPGCNFLMEGAIGTHPKIKRPRDVLESLAARSGWHYDRRRSGVLHFGFGQADDTQWAENRGLPSSHFHVHQYFCTYQVELRDGTTVKLIDRGRLTVLDDPEVQAFASQYGDANQLLREDWIPAIPGINVPGEYSEYSQDPALWIRKDLRAHYR